MCLGVNRHLMSGHEISRLQHGLQLRPTSIPSGILMHPAVWPQGPKIGERAPPPFLERGLGPHLTQSRYTRIINCRPCCNLYVSYFVTYFYAPISTIVSGVL